MENRHTVYFNMCHHYRKILNAKSCVDSSPPKTFQANTNNQWRFNRGASPLSQKILNQDNYKHRTQETMCKSNSGSVICQYYYQHHYKHAQKKVDKSFAVPEKPFNPTILRTNVQSKLRNSNVYHPPRKKRVMLKVSEKTAEISKNSTDSVAEENSKRPHSAIDNSFSEESSEDSAYNEGEGILSSDSRGSTPQNANNKLQVSLKKSSVDLKLMNPTNPSVTRTKSDEVVCIHFLKDITNDILGKNIFTNKALRNVFQHHVQINKYNLNMEKMLDEITKLQERLGVPTDDKFDDEDYGLGRSTSKENISIEDANEDEGITSNVISPSLPVDAEIELNVNQNPPAVSQDTVIIENLEEHDYSDNFSDDSDDKSYTSQSEDQAIKCEDSSTTDEDEIEVVSEIGEETQDIDENSEKHLDIEESTKNTIINNVDSDSNAEISEAC